MYTNSTGHCHQRRNRECFIEGGRGISKLYRFCVYIYIYNTIVDIWNFFNFATTYWTIQCINIARISTIEDLSSHHPTPTKKKKKYYAPGCHYKYIYHRVNGNGNSNNIISVNNLNGYKCGARKLWGIHIFLYIFSIHNMAGLETRNSLYIMTSSKYQNLKCIFCIVLYILSIL